MNNITPVIMLRSLDVVRGGVTKASIKRANMLAEEYGEVIMATFVFQQHHNKIIKDLYDKNLLSNNIKVINFFEDIKPNTKKLKKSRNKELQSIKEKGLHEFRVKKYKKEPSYRYYKDGLYVKYKRFNEGGTLKFIDYMDSSRHRVKREEFNEQGYLVRTRHMDKTHNKSRLDRYFDHAGDCYLSVHVDPKKGKEGRTAMFTSDPVEFDSLHECKQLWLNRILSELEHPVVTSELRGLHKLLRGAEHNNIKKIEVVHTNHLMEPFDDIKNIKTSYVELFEHANKLNHVVFLTDEQKEDVEEVYGFHDNFSVIPHACKPVSNKENKQHRKFNPKSAVTLARFHEDKRLDEAIHAFKFVVEKIPEAKYYIYGYGKLKNKLQELINRLNLENNVLLQDYTLDPEETYRSAACSILTSRQEGFAMVLTESMATGTPVVSYNTKYGPADIIENGVNGFLVPQGDREQLAEKIIKIMQDSRLREQLSENAVHVKETFSEETYRKRWLNLIT